METGTGVGSLNLTAVDNPLNEAGLALFWLNFMKDAPPDSVCAVGFLLASARI